METLLAFASSTYLGKGAEQADGRNMEIGTMNDALLDTNDNGQQQSRGARRSRARNSNAMLDRLAATPGFVDKAAEPEGAAIAERRRTPRMASLNAAAKVNLFFEPSSPLAGRSMVEIQEHAKPKAGEKRPSGSEVFFGHRELPHSARQQFGSMGFSQQEISSTSSEPFDLSEKGSVVEDSGSDDSEVFEENGVDSHYSCRKRRLEADSTSEAIKRPRQAPELRNSAQNGDIELECSEFDMECDTTTISPPRTMVDACIQVDLPKSSTTHPKPKPLRMLSVPIRGQLVTSSGSFPFTKKHVVSPVTPAKPPPELTVSRATSTKRTAGLNAKAMVNAMLASNGPLSKYKSMTGNLMDGARRKPKVKEGKTPFAPLKIPKINFAATSTSTFSAGRSRPAGNPVKNVQLKSLNLHLEKLLARGLDRSVHLHDQKVKMTHFLLTQFQAEA